MDKNSKIKKQPNENLHPKDRANFLSHFLFCWQLNLLYKNWKNRLTDEEILAPLKSLESQHLGDQLESVWENEVFRCKKPSLTKCLLKTFGVGFFLNGLLFFLLDMTITVGQPFCLAKLLDNLTLPPTKFTQKNILTWGSVIVGMYFLQTLANNFFLLQMSTFGSQIRVACCSLLYRKVLKLEKSEIQKISSGRIVNLLMSEMEKFDIAFRYAHFLWIVPVKTIVNFGYFCFYFDLSCAAGIGLLIMILLVQTYNLKIIAARRKETAVQNDLRISLMNEIITRIQVIKMYTLEEACQDMIKNIRKIELKKILTTNFYRNLILSIPLYLTLSCVLLSILASVLFTSSLKLNFIYVLTTLNNSDTFFVVSVSHLASITVSIQRLQDILLIGCKKSDEKCTYRLKRNSQQCKNGVILKNVVVDLSVNVFTCDSFTATSSNLIAVVGPPGSGKSTLLEVILKEIDLVEGEISVGGTVSYASQEPWIFPDSVRENILFGEEMDEEKYWRVVRMCALHQDLSLFSHSDNTLVGERGVRLSGGQKARVSLARAVYRDADIYLLDDPFSALDSTVANHVFNECVLDYLKEKCVVLVTHQIQYLENVDRIYVWGNGTITARGKYEDLKDLIGRSVAKWTKKEVTETDSKIEEKKKPSEIEEDCKTCVKNPYKSYFVTHVNWTLCVLLILYIFIQVIYCANFYILSQWINQKQELISEISEKDSKFLAFYGGLTLLLIVLIKIAVLVFTKHCYIASTKLHDSLFTQLINASMTFYNDHFSGRILNRFSRDIGVVDELVPQKIFALAKISLTITGALILIFIVNFWMILPSVVMFVMLYFFVLIFSPIINRIKKEEKTKTSPIGTHISASLQGLVTIRALRAQNLTLSKFNDHQNCHSSVYYVFEALYFAYAFWADVAVTVYSSVVIFSCLAFQNVYPAGNIGLIITQSLIMVGRLQLGMKTWTDLNALMTSVERVADYTDLTEERDEGNFAPPDSWPEEGKIIFDSVSMRYSPDQASVLKNVTFTVNPGEKIGIVGRTGAGKSSLVSVLFRLFHFEGKIYIDGVDTKILPLKTLRSKISIIPQEPVLFKGTLRSNLDPFNQFTDSELWRALEDVEMKNLVCNLPLGLDTIILENSSNFSLGQRQLLCLARVVLKKSKIVVLDEATANIDLKTDELIQKTLRKRFASSTVLTIAHRLDTLKDSHKVLVMDQGRVVEFSSPEKNHFCN